MEAGREDGGAIVKKRKYTKRVKSNRLTVKTAKEPASLDARRQAIHDLIDRYFDRVFACVEEFAARLGEEIEKVDGGA